MSEKKKENLFAQLAAQNQKTAVKEEPAVTLEETAIEPPPSPAPPKPTNSKPVSPKKKGETQYGKKGNPDYCQANSYIPKSLLKSVQKALLDTDGLDYSSLVEELLTKWVKSRRVSD
jgi:hypothetical protein